MRNKVIVFFASAPPPVREMLNRALASGDIDVRWAANEREALELSQAQPPDLLLVDFNRPLKRALKAVEQLQVVNAFVPIILITEQQTEFEHAVEDRVAALIRKPFEMSMLLRKLREVLNPISEVTEPDALHEHATTISRAND